MKRGRPRRWEHPLIYTIPIAVSTKEKKRVQELAKKAGLSVSGYLRTQLKCILIEGIEKETEENKEDGS